MLFANRPQLVIYEVFADSLATRNCGIRVAVRRLRGKALRFACEIVMHDYGAMEGILACHDLVMQLGANDIAAVRNGIGHSSLDKKKAILS
jgi:hypothetical protein